MLWFVTIYTPLFLEMALQKPSTGAFLIHQHLALPLLNTHHNTEQCWIPCNDALNRIPLISFIGCLGLLAHWSLWLVHYWSTVLTVKLLIIDAFYKLEWYSTTEFKVKVLFLKDIVFCFVFCWGIYVNLNMYGIFFMCFKLFGFFANSFFKGSV